MTTLRYRAISCTFLVSIALIAQSHAESISCPSVTQIQQIAEKIDSADYVNNSYIAYTSAWAIRNNGLGWYVFRYNLTAASKNQAISLGKELVRLVSSQKDKIAENLAGTYMCNYDEGNVLAMGGDDQPELLIRVHTNQ